MLYRMEIAQFPQPVIPLTVRVQNFQELDQLRFYTVHARGIIGQNNNTIAFPYSRQYRRKNKREIARLRPERIANIK